MIVGSGLLARAFSPRFGSDPDVLIFASGVSNSQEQSEAAFARESRLLAECLSFKKRLIYFSSCNVVNVSQASPYFDHKRRMERMVLNNDYGRVIRLPQVVGNSPNPNTLTNFIHSKIEHSEYFSVWSRAERNLIDVDDVCRIATFAIDHHPDQRILCVAGPQTLPMPCIVEIFEKVLGRTANVSYEDKGDAMAIDTKDSMAIACALGLDFGSDYIERLIRKYYGDKNDH